VTIRYAGHAERWDSVKIDGSLERRDATVSFIQGGAKRAVATVSRDRECLEAELALESLDSVTISKR
jgi:3-phenylpropionate/trans-cinnamate dioxygenase ferredoxin reductase subunit